MSVPQKKADSEFVLLGPQDKLCTSNIAYQLRKPVVSATKVEETKPKKVVSEVAPKEVSKKEDLDFVILGPERKSDFNAVAYKYKSQKVSKAQTVKRINAPKSAEVKVKLTKSAPVVQVDTGAVVTKKQEPVKNLNLPMSEYQKAFLWTEKQTEKKEVQISEAQKSPILKAQDQQQYRVVEIIVPQPVKLSDNEPEKSNSELVATKAKPKESEIKRSAATRFQRTSEYRASFGNYFRPVSQAKSTNNLSNAEPKPDDKTTNKSEVKLALNPQEPFMPHGKLKRWKSEYNCQFTPYYSEDSEKKASKQKSDWFNNIIELRQKALEYKQRSYGVHFSSTHLAQLNAKNLHSWDMNSESSSERTLSTLSSKASVSQIEEPKSVKVTEMHQAPEKNVEKIQPTVTVAKKKTTSSGIRSNTNAEPLKIEISFDSEPKYLHSCATQTAKASARVSNEKQKPTEDPETRTRVLLDELLKLHRSKTPMSRLADNLDSNQVRTHMQWDSNSEDSYGVSKPVPLVEKHANLLEEAKKKAYEERQGKKAVKEAFMQKIERLSLDDDLESLSQFSTRSLASSSSLLDRAKSNQEKFWGNHHKNKTILVKKSSSKH